MNSDRLRPLFVLGAFAAAPFLFGADGKGCQPVLLTGDGGPAADGGPGGPGDGADPSDSGGPCVSPAGGPCGGFTQAPCVCAPGLACQTNRIPDIPGVCVAPADAACIDNVLCIMGDHFDPVLCKCVPDVEAGAGPDAACIDNVLCIMGDHFDPVLCKCVPDVEGGSGRDAACVDNVLCITGDHFDPVLCRCVPDVEAGSGRDAACVDNVLCIRGDHWDPQQCKCVPTAPGCTTAADCHGALPQICLQSCDGGPGACAHFACMNGACETVICE
jgi:hypothetical protein